MYTITLQASSAAELFRELQVLAGSIGKTIPVIDKTFEAGSLVPTQTALSAETKPVKAQKKTEPVKPKDTMQEDHHDRGEKTAIEFSTCKDAMLELAKKKGRDATLQVLGQFQDVKGQPCGRVTAVQEKDYEAFMDAVTETLKDEEA